MFSSRIKSKNTFSETGVYKIPCKNCDQYYIGEIGRSFILRLKEHRQMKDLTKFAIANHRFMICHEKDVQSPSVIHTQNSIFKR